MDILDDINWNELGYPDLSEAFRNLNSKNKKKRDEVHDMLYHKDLFALTKVTPYLVPYLIELLDIPKIEEKDRIIGIIIDWTLESISALSHANYKNYANNLLLKIKQGLDIYQNIASNHEDEETRIGAQQLLDIINVEM